MNVKINLTQKIDWDFILQVRNSESVRIACHNTSIITPDEHEKYIKKISKNPNAFIWIILVDDQKAGYIKIIDSEWGAALKEEFRGKGVGTIAYNLVFDKLKKIGFKKLTATVKVDRNTSLTFEEKTGWKKKDMIYKDGKEYAYLLEKYL